MAELSTYVTKSSRFQLTIIEVMLRFLEVLEVQVLEMLLEKSTVGGKKWEAMVWIKGVSLIRSPHSVGHTCHGSSQDCSVNSSPAPR